jgi:hypothetical protein
MTIETIVHAAAAGALMVRRRVGAVSNHQRWRSSFETRSFGALRRGRWGLEFRRRAADDPAFFQP